MLDSNGSTGHAVHGCFVQGIMVLIPTGSKICLTRYVLKPSRAFGDCRNGFSIQHFPNLNWKCISSKSNSKLEFHIPEDI